MRGTQRDSALHSHTFDHLKVFVLLHALVTLAIATLKVLRKDKSVCGEAVSIGDQATYE
jgi:hypothetical protein